MADPIDDPNTLEEVPILTLRQQIFNDISTATGNFLDIDYSAGELLGKSIVDLTTAKVPLVRQAIYGFSSLISVLETIDTYLPESPLFGDPNAAPFGTTEADFHEVTRSLPSFDLKKLEKLSLSNEQQRRLARIGHNMNKLVSHVKHLRKVAVRSKATGVPVSQATKLVVRKPGVQKPYVASVSVPTPTPVQVRYVTANTPVPIQYIPTPPSRTNELMKLALQRSRIQ